MDKRLALILTLTLLTGCILAGPDTPLRRASGEGDLAAMTALLDGGADPDAPGAYGMTPLAAAARAGRVDALDLLVARGANPHKGCGVNGWTPLLHALHKNQMEAAIRLIDTAAQPSAELDDALFMASGYAEAQAVDALLAKGADPRKERGDGANALSSAVAGAFDIDYTYRGCPDHTAVVRDLLQHAPDLKLEGAAGAKARRAAERRGCSEMLALLDRG
ncbi:MAG TPA: ankyrin repeat domain-containing protein [Candidatus Polarisedimenticolaceae bacterium]|nr:ankyrin repeat domain-containing protein [Candidatus Polarisedimenticolaceae bacterium]